MAAVTICSDFGAPKNKVWHCFHCFPIYFPWSDGMPWSLFSECWALSQLFHSPLSLSRGIFSTRLSKRVFSKYFLFHLLVSCLPSLQSPKPLSPMSCFIFSWRWYLRWGFCPLWWVTVFLGLSHVYLLLTFCLISSCWFVSCWFTS